MSRLTEKPLLEIVKINKVERVTTTPDCFLKLGQLEDIEEELGIDLITLFKALKNGIWLKEDNKIRFIAPYKLSLAIDKCCANSYVLLEKNSIYAISECDNWALAKEELEK